MELMTKHFGALVVSESEMFIFERGLPGFPNDKRFIIIFDESDDNKVYWLQSMDNGDVALALIDSFSVMPEYDPLIEESQFAEIDFDGDIDNLLVFSVVIVGDSLSESFVNLKTPIIINNANKKGKQIVVSNEEYYINHRLDECLISEGGI